jgi:hypothetical protein
VKLKAARLPRHVTDPVEETRIGVEQHVVVLSDIDDTVVCGEYHSLARTQRRCERADGSVEFLQPLRPLGRLPPVLVPGLVEFRNVDVDQCPGG